MSNKSPKAQLAAMNAKRNEKLAAEHGLLQTEGVYRLAKYASAEGLSRYTGVIDWYDNEGEEIDVDAMTRKEARETVIKALKADYELGYTKIEILGARAGLYV